MIRKNFQLTTNIGIKGPFETRQEARQFWMTTFPNHEWDDKNLIEVTVFWELNEWADSTPKN